MSLEEMERGKVRRERERGRETNNPIQTQQNITQKIILVNNMYLPRNNNYVKVLSKQRRHISVTQHPVMFIINFLESTVMAL
jgi:hypothetical protein